MSDSAARGRRRGRARSPVRRMAPPVTSDAIRRFAARYPFTLDAFQLEALRALDAGHSVLAAAPTGTGKTVLAEFGIQLAREQGLRVIYTAPIKALSNQKFRDWRALYGDVVGLLTGDVTHNPDGSILVMTTEVLRNMLLQSVHALDDVGCVIFDEVHFLADPERGTTWEEAILYCPPHVQLVCLSATVANADEIAAWISRVHRDTVLVSHHTRAVPLEHYYFLEDELHLMLDATGVAPEPLRVGGEARYPKPDGISRNARPRDVPRPREVVRALGQAQMLPAIYFIFGRRGCEMAAQDCAGLDLVGDRASRQARRERIEAYLNLLEGEDRRLEQVERLMALLHRGIAFHHAGLLPMLKGLVEELFTAGLIGTVFATETLALGINMPARSVVIAEPTKFDGESRRPLLPNEYAQLTGRAGRRGLDPVGYAVNLYSPWVSYGESLSLVTGELLPIRSAFTPRYNTVAALWDGSEAGRERLLRLFASSLRQFQMNDELRAAAGELDALRATAAELHFTCPFEGIPDDAVVEYISLRRNLSDARQRARRASSTRARRARTDVEPGTAGLATAGAREETAAQEVEALQIAVDRHPCAGCPYRAEHERSLRREMAAIRALAESEHHVAGLERATASQAEATLDALTDVLRRFGYLAGESLVPTEKSAVLTRVYDQNGLLLVDLAWRGVFAHLAPAELMELLSWYCYDREGPRWNRNQLTPRLWEVRAEVENATTTVQRAEARAGLAITTGFNPDFFGSVLSWCRGTGFAELLEHVPISEGDLLLALNKTLDLATQVREALRAGAPNSLDARALAAKLEIGDRLLRRGIVAQSLRLATGVPPSDESRSEPVPAR